ncbi:beta-galactosidase [Acrocarpospora corrugata]|nr:beta-galactosidase [Acrocarpospora corrugata]
MFFGGDYNPEQWPEQSWPDDVARMREAGVNLVTVGVFSWALLEPAEGRYEFGWLDRILDLLADGGIGVDLATATASPPPWLSVAYPDSLPVDADGHRLWPGSRQAYCPSSPRYRTASVRLARTLAERYGGHRALRMWHVGNEYGCHVPRCYCDVSAEAFRTWLRERYDLAALNETWGTRFWSQEYTSFDQVLPPRRTPAFSNPTQVLDFARFSSAELLDCYRGERDVLRELTPDVPVTTNFMAGMHWEMDYWAWAAEVDLVSNDHYIRVHDPHGHVNLAFSADVTRGLAGGEPWLLMEHSTSAVNWQPRNVPKTPGQMRRNSLTHVARGSEGALFFQWRASKAGAEKYHSALLPHAGTDSRIWREVVELGSDLGKLAEVTGSVVSSTVAIVLSWESVWAQERPSQPSADMTATDELAAWHAALWRLGITVDFVAPGADISGYRVVMLPSLYLLSGVDRDVLARYVESGGTLVVGAYSGVVDERDHIVLDGYPGALREVLGVRMEEFVPLLDGQTITLSDGSAGRVWREFGRVTTAEVIAAYADGEDAWSRWLAGHPAITRNTRGDGTAWYVSTRLDPPSLERLLGRITGEAGVAGSGVPLELVRRSHADGRTYLFAINHDEEGAVPLDVAGVDLLTGADFPGEVPPGGVVVIKVVTP